WDALFRGTVLADATVSSAGKTTANANSVWDINLDGKWLLPNGHSNVDLYGIVNNHGTCELGLGANMIAHDGSAYNLYSKYVCDGGHLTLEAGTTPKDGPQWFLSGDALLLEKSGSVIFGAKDFVPGFGTIKIAGGIFENFGTTTDKVIKDG